MSKQVKKPAEATARKIKNSSLLPQIFNTDPNNKMLDSTLDLMTSKGQLSNFKETYGIRSASNKLEEFFKVESDEVRRESQSNTMLVLNDSADGYLGKASYLDIENYFRVKGLELKDGIQLDKNVNVLDLPIIPLRLTDYSSFYWIANDLPAIKIHINPARIDQMGALVVGQRYKIRVLGNSDFTTVGAVLATAGEFVPGIEYTIITDDLANDTDWNRVAGTSNLDYIRGDTFVAANSGAGNGTSQAYTSWFTATASGIAEATFNGTASVPKFTITDDLLTRPFATLVDDVTGKTLILQTGMILYFTGVIETTYFSIDEDAPKTFYVYGVGENIQLYRALEDKRIPDSWLKKRPWDKSSALNDAPAIKWDSEVWDGSSIVTSETEYITIDKYSSNQNHWQLIDHWYHINLIKTVADFIGADISEIVTPENKAKRPIITFHRRVQLFNWPNNVRAEIKAMLPGNLVQFNGKETIVSNGYTLVNGDKVAFTGANGIYTVSFAPGATFTKTLTSAEGDGALIVSNSDVRYYKIIYKNAKWQFAQNKTSKNQAPLFEFYLSDGTNLETLYSTDFAGGKILDFAPGSAYDAVLNRHIEISNIDFDLINENNSLNISPNQIKFVTDVDRTFTYTEENTSVTKTVTGPYGYKYINVIPSFYQSRRGLDLTRQTQDLLYQTDTDSQWTSEVIPTARGFNRIHVYYDTAENLKFYYEVEGHGLVRFSSKRGSYAFEQLLPLIAGGKMQIVCHDLPVPITLYKLEIVNNISREVPLAFPYCINNGITNGVIELDLSSSIDTGAGYVDNELNVDNLRLFWSIGTVLKLAIVRPVNRWRFLQFAYLRDKTDPIYDGYDYYISDLTLDSGELSTQQVLTATSALNKKADNGDKICVDTVLAQPVNRTSPVSLTTNPLNKELDVINYYSLYQHATNIKSNSTNIKEYTDPESVLESSTLGGGTFLKHSDPIARAAIMATNMPFDFTEIIIKQGKHYDTFQSQLKSQLQIVIDTVDYTTMSSLALLDLALKRIYLNQKDNDNFWNHSNMMGWGNSTDYKQRTITVGSEQVSIDPISHLAGKETILHISHNNRILTRDVDYTLIANSTGYYTDVSFNAALLGETVSIYEWYVDFNSKIPASLAKIGLAPVYVPEIYLDESYSIPEWFMIRHDGTCLRLVEGVVDGYPVNLVDQLLYEYEKAVWSSIAYDVENNSNIEYYENTPGLFRGGRYSWKEARATIVSEMHSWMAENEIFVMKNTGFDQADANTHIYVLGSGDDETTTQGSWRAFYRWMYDTDRPHSHPWEMLGYTRKPLWWDTHYSWTDPVKRTALEKALRTGNVAAPPTKLIKPQFARLDNIEEPEPFPVDADGKLIPLGNLNFLNLIRSLGSEANWVAGDLGPYEFVFLNTQRGLAAQVRARYLLSPAQFVNNNWVPGHTFVNEWGLKLDRTTGFWQQGAITHNYHRQVVDNATVYTAGLESLFSEFATLNNKDFKSTVIDKFNNIKVNKEFMLSGFSSKDNIRIESTSISTQRKALFVPEENYQVRLVKHYTGDELFYSAMRIVWTGSAYSLQGFASELGSFSILRPFANSPVVARTIGTAVIKEKTTYYNIAANLPYGEEFSDKQDVYDRIMGYGKYLEAVGFKFEEVEDGDIRDWQHAAKQFVFWSNDVLQAGNYIDLNPAANGIVLSLPEGQLENLEGTNENAGQCVDRMGNALFSKDLLVSRTNPLIVKTKDTANPIYGIKLSFSTYESVVHLDSTSIFDDVYFLPEQGTTKRSFVFGGKKSQSWDGKYFIPGYVFSKGSIIPNYDSMSEVGRNLLDVENVLENTDLLEASRSQFGLNRNPELRQLFLQEENEVLFKNAITYNKGTSQVFAGLEPLTHNDGSSTVPLEEYMIRVGELGNTKNIEYYEFELSSNDLVKNPQIINFASQYDTTTTDYIHYVKDKSSKWIHRPYGKQLSFETTNLGASVLKDSPIVTGDTNFVINNLDDLPSIYEKLSDIWSIPSYDEEASYKQYDQVRYNGSIYYAVTTVSPNTFTVNQDKFTKINEPFLPNIFVKNYYKPNPSLVNFADSIFTPGTWQVLQTIDGNLHADGIGIGETCPGPSDVSKARITTTSPHYLSIGDYVMIVNAEDEVGSVNGIWKVTALGTGINPATGVDYSTMQFYIDTRVTTTIKVGKIFRFKPVRFKTSADLFAATTDITKGYNWKKNFNPFTNILGTTNIVLPATPSGYDPVYPIAIVDDAVPQDDASVTFDYGNFAVYQMTNTWPGTQVKAQSLSVDPETIEHLLIYDYNKNRTLAKVELFDPKKLYLHSVFKDDIDIISRVDPAKYTKTTDEYKAVYSSLGWYEEYVGRRWWDTSTLQFNDYENGDDTHRAKYWGTTVDNTLPDIYEWTKSPVHPSQWKQLVDGKEVVYGQLATGQVFIDKTLNTDNYHWVEEQDYINGNLYVVYYFWVKNKDTISSGSTAARTYSTGQLSKVILNPSAAGLAWYAPIGPRSIMLKGVEPYVNAENTVVQIKKKTKGQEKSQQWIFISENNPSETIPEWVHRRFRDSISGFIHYTAKAPYVTFSTSAVYKQSNIIYRNGRFYVCRRNGTTGPFYLPDWQILSGTTLVDSKTFMFDIDKNVPDIFNLHRFALAGNQIRPYAQSWFLDTIEARRNLVKKINKLLINVDITSLQNWGRRINQTAYLLFGQTYDLTKFWKLVDYKSVGFNEFKEIAITVETVADIYTSGLGEGEYIKVLEDNSIYEKTTNGGWLVVYRAADSVVYRGAIEFSDDLFKNYAWDSHPWDNSQVAWDFNLNSILYVIIEALRNDLFVDEYQTNYAKTICAMFRYVLSEQQDVDWIQKSSTSEPLNLIGQQLQRTTSLERDKIDVLVDFYTSVKSYRDKIRSGTITKQLVENASLEFSEMLEIDGNEVEIK